jgi:hypothetical protein
VSAHHAGRIRGEVGYHETGFGGVAIAKHHARGGEGRGGGNAERPRHDRPLSDMGA